MEWIEKLNSAINYIENNLADEIDTEEAARIAVCSAHHFQRMFPYIAGVTLSEYIRRRKMTLAAFELLSSNIKVIELAMKYGYESPTAFNRAFQGVHGVSPSAARESGAKLSAFPRIAFTLSIKGAEVMNYKIEKKPSFRIVGVSMQELMTMEECLVKIPQFWRTAAKDSLLHKLCALVGENEPHSIFGVCTNEKGKLSNYYIAVKTDAPIADGMEEYWIPESEWAIFDCVGAMPGAIQKMQQRVLSEWLPASGYEYACAPDIEVYFDGDRSSPDYRTQIWLPVAKK